MAFSQRSKFKGLAKKDFIFDGVARVSVINGILNPLRYEVFSAFGAIEDQKKWDFRVRSIHMSLYQQIQDAKLTPALARSFADGLRSIAQLSGP